MSIDDESGEKESEEAYPVIKKRPLSHASSPRCR